MTTHSPGSRAYRAVITVGQLDTEVQGLTPLNENYELAGASSDLAVVNLGDNLENLHPGSIIQFRPTYGALVRLMAGKYITKHIRPSLKAFAASSGQQASIDVPPVLDDLDLES